MKWKLVILLTLLIFLISIATAGFGIDNENIPVLRPPVVTSTNVTNITNNYYNQTVNATVNETQFDNNSPVNINSTWLESLIESVANGLSKWSDYLLLSGGTMSGELNMDGNNISSVGNITTNCITLEDGFQYCTLSTTYYNGTAAQNVSGTIEGTINLTQHSGGSYDGITLNITEVAGSPGLDLRVNFTNGITDFTQGIMRYYTSSLSGDYPIIQLWDYDSSSWEDYPSISESLSFKTITQPVFDTSEHIQDGIVQMRIYKASNGNINNKYYIDWLAISKGFGVPSGEETDPISYHKNSNINATGYNITADYFFGDGSQLTGISGGGGNPFDQVLNTTNSPTFVSLTLNHSKEDEIGVIYKDSDWFIHDYEATNTTGQNTFLGDRAGNFNMAYVSGAVDASYNTGVGYQALYRLTKGYQNNAIGHTALNYCSEGFGNNAMGYGALTTLTSGSWNNAMGGTALQLLTTGKFNNAVGADSMKYTETGEYSTAIGYQAGRGAYSYSHSYNTMIGARAGYSIRTGANNNFIGYGAGYRQTTNSNLLIVDNQVRADVATEKSNAIIYGVMDSTPSNQYLRINGALAVGGNNESGLSSGDINASTIYYDTLTAKSPIILCSDDWCSVDFPKLRKQIYIHKTEDWRVDEIIYNETSYSVISFWQLVQGTQYEDLALKLNEKLVRLQDKYDCESQGYIYNGSCYYIRENIINSTYSDAITINPIYNITLTEYPCITLNEKLEEVESTCSNSTQTSEIISYSYDFKPNCYYDNGYKCKTSKVIFT